MKRILTIFLICATVTNAEPPADIDTVRFDRDLTLKESRKSALSFLSSLRGIYHYPICRESSPRENEIVETEGSSFEFEIRKDETLSSCLDRLLAETEDLYLRDEIHGMTVVHPSNESTLFDSLIDLKLHDVSTWEALKALAIAVNQREDAAVPLEVSVPNTTGYTSHLVPQSFAGERVLDLDVKGATIRSVLCKILSKAPTQISYSYSRFRNGHLLQVLCLTDRVALEPDDGVPDELDRWWRKEQRDIVEAFSKK